MPTTDNVDLPYPSTDDAPNVPADVQALADAVDAILASLLAGTTGTITQASPFTVGSNSRLIKLGRIVILTADTTRATGSSASYTTFATVPSEYWPAVDTAMVSSVPAVTSGVLTKAQVTATGNLQIAMSGASASSMNVVGIWQSAS